MLPKRAFRAMLPTIICVSPQFRAIDPPNPIGEGSSSKSKMRVALQRRAFPNVTMCVSPQRRAQKCMNLRPASRKQICKVLLQFWAIDTTFLPRGLRESKQNLRFATVLGDRHHVFPRGLPAGKMKFP